MVSTHALGAMSQDPDGAFSDGKRTDIAIFIDVVLIFDPSRVLPSPAIAQKFVVFVYRVLRNEHTVHRGKFAE